MAVDARDVALGFAAAGARAGGGVVRVWVVSAQVAGRAPIVGGPLRRAAEDLEAQGRALRGWMVERLELTVGDVLASPEVERAIDRALEGPLMDAVARSLAEHRVVERVATQVAATADLERIAARIAETADLERLLLAALNSQLMVALTEHVVNSPEMERVVAHIANSPEVRRALTKQSTSLAEEMVTGVRRRTETLDDAAERAVRGWLRRPKPRPA
jgi:hypothetical protein